MDDIQPELRNFLDLVNGKAPANAYCQQIADSVNEAKHSVEVMHMFMNVNLKQMEEVYEAREEARAEMQAKYEAQLAAKDAEIADMSAEIARLKAEIAAASNK